MKVVRVSNGMFKSLRTCDTQAWLRTKGFVSIEGHEDQEAPMRCGSAAHLAFEAWLQRKSTDECVSRFLKDYQPYSDRWLLPTGKQARYWHENVARILEVFLATNPIIMMPFEVVETETPIEWIIERFYNGGTESPPYLRYVISDKADALVRMKDTGDYFAFENKTIQYIPDDYLNDYALDSQITIHVAAQRSQNVDCKGVFLQVLQITKLPDAGAVTKTGKPLRCRIAGHGYQRDCWADHVKSVRFPLVRAEDDIGELKRNALPLITGYEELLNEKDIGFVAQQGLFGRCGRCEYLKFCLSKRQNWDILKQKEREPGVAYSGIYEEDDGQVA